MGITVFLLICGPVAALMYFPLTTQQFRPAPADATPRAAESTPPAAKGLHAMRWSHEPEDHIRGWKNAA